MTEKALTTEQPFPDAAACLEEWFCALGPLNGLPCTDRPSGILALSERLPEIELLLARTAATRQAGTAVPVLDVLEALGLDLPDRLATLALLRVSMGSRLREGLRFQELGEAVGAACWRDQETLRERLESSGALRRLGLLQCDDDSLEPERLYRLNPRWKAPLLAGETRPEPERVELPASPATRLQAAIVTAIELLSWIAPGSGSRSTGWADPVPDGPGWDHTGPKRRALTTIAAILLHARDSSHADPLGALLAEAGVTRPAEVVLLLLLLARRPEEGPVSWAVLGPALDGIPGNEVGFEALVGAGSVLRREGLVELRSEAEEGPLAAFSATPGAKSRAFPRGIPLFEARLEKDEAAHAATPDVEVTAPRLRLDGIVLPRAVRDRIEEALDLPRALASDSADWGLDESLLGSPGVVLLFHGAPGTGKTLCAEAIAGELGRSLWRLRVDQLVSRWAGETEKNLASVFRRARVAGDVILLDEADSLLAARGVQTQRWEVSMTNLLLQEVERFPGVLVVTTNRLDSLDPALERRVLARIEFPMPDAEGRLALWKRHIPARIPLAADVDLAAIARAYPLSGSQIRTASLFAVARAARRPKPRRMLAAGDLHEAAAAQHERSAKSRLPVGFTPIETRLFRPVLAAIAPRAVVAEPTADPASH